MLLSNSMLILYFEEWYNFPDDRRNYNPFTKQNLKSIRKVHKILKQRKAQYKYNTFLFQSFFLGIFIFSMSN